VVAEELFDSDTTIIVADSKLGWAKALKELIHLLYSGQIPKWDVSKVRPAGTPLKTFGGRASGPEPLVSLFKFCVAIFKKAAGRRLTTLECHDIITKIAEIVVVGGVRRSALISLSDLSDDRLRYAKSGQWWTDNVQRALANNSAVYNVIPDMAIFMDEWKALYDSKSGERGIFSRASAKKNLLKYGRRDASHDMGLNPCAEILLRSSEFCNLSEAVVRATDSEQDIQRKIRLATILGTMQSTLTNFKYISKKWKQNCEEERLLGVSLTGIIDSVLTNGKSGGLKERLENWREIVVATNKEWAEKIGIPQSVAVTAIKPSGTVSALVDSASGIHARHSPFYIRTIRADKKDPLAKMMIDMGFPVEDDITKPDHTYVFSFPMKAPQNAIFRKDMTAIEQLELWLQYKKHYTEHNPSVTISVKEHEWMEVGAWVYKNFDEMTGVSFLPFSEHVYAQAPFQDCSEEEYEALLAKMPKSVDWSKLSEYEKTDQTEGIKEFACSAGGCELV
jgi:ribonucleoside-triphosphate reductase